MGTELTDDTVISLTEALVLSKIVLAKQYKKDKTKPKRPFDFD